MTDRAGAAAAVTALQDAPVALAAPPAGPFEAVTTAFAGLLGTTPAACRGTSLTDHLAPEDHALLDRVVHAETPAPPVRVAGRTTDGRPVVLVVRAGGGTVSLERTGPPTTWRGAPAATVGESSPAGFDHALAHDVRGSLRSVKSFLQLAGRAAPDVTKLAHHLEVAARAATDADHQLEQLVRMWRLGHRPLVVGPVPVGAIFERAVGHVGPPPEGSEGPRWPASLEAGPTTTVVGDGALLGDLLGELVVNARRFGGPDGEVTVEVVPDGPWTRIRVTDRGPGIPAELRADALLPGRMLQPRGRFPGVGMGLAVAATIAEIHGGALRLGATEGGGCTAHVRLITSEATPSGPG